MISSIDASLIDSLIDLRRRLHQHPELSGAENQTAQTIKAYLASTRPDEVHEGIGGAGLAFVYCGDEPGPRIGFRCELDALPIHEPTMVPYHSLAPGVAHKCGHDGHMAMVAGMGMLAGIRKPKRGALVLIFQPAEETGAGGPAYTADPRYAALQLDAVFAIHNLPSRPMGAAVLRSGAFCCASKGMTITLKGRTAHAASPETGRSPADAMCKIIAQLQNLPSLPSTGDTFCRVTVVGARLGEKAFGTAPDHAEIWATLRSDSDDAMAQITDAALAIAKEAAAHDGLGLTTSFEDVFTVTANDREAVDQIQAAATQCDTPVIRLEEPMRFSEDFGQFTRRTKGALFGLGSGPGPQLHNDDYDFPDQLIEVGLKIYAQLFANLTQAE